jgi:hypothetical protein
VKQLRAGVGSFLADDDPHAFRPGRQVQHAGDLVGPGARPGLAAGVLTRRVRAGGDREDGIRNLVGDSEPGGVGEAPPRAWPPRPGSRGCRRDRCGSAPGAPSGGVSESGPVG